jgi:hypothetical protein
VTPETWPLAVFAMRVVAVVALYGFLLFAFNIMRRELRAARAAGRAPAAHAGNAWLEVIDEVDGAAPLGQRYRLAPVTTIGRGSGSTLRLDDPRISTRHAQVRWLDGNWWVEDLGSTNGTFVAGQRVERSSPLADGGAFSVGPVRLRLVEASE